MINGGFGLRFLFDWVVTMKSLLMYVCLLTFTLSTSATAAVYKWTDADGSIHFGDQPPAAQKTENINIATPPRSSSSEIPKESVKERQEKLLKTMDEEKAAKQKAQEKQAKLDAENKQKCQELNNYKQNLETARRIVRTNSNGEREYLSDDERAKESSRTNAEITRYCH